MNTCVLLLAVVAQKPPDESLYIGKFFDGEILVASREAGLISLTARYRRNNLRSPWPGDLFPRVQVFRDRIAPENLVYDHRYPEATWRTGMGEGRAYEFEDRITTLYMKKNPGAYVVQFHLVHGGQRADEGDPRNIDGWPGGDVKFQAETANVRVK